MMILNQFSLGLQFWCAKWTFSCCIY